MLFKTLSFSSIRKRHRSGYGDAQLRGDIMMNSSSFSEPSGNIHGLHVNIDNTGRYAGIQRCNPSFVDDDDDIDEKKRFYESLDSEDKETTGL